MQLLKDIMHNFPCAIMSLLSNGLTACRDWQGVENQEAIKDEGENIIVFDENDVVEGVGGCYRSLIGIVRTKKPINRNNI